MPLIEVHLIENVFNPEQKRQIIEKLTDAMVTVEGENMRGVTWVKISEVASGEWGIGGQPLVAPSGTVIVPFASASSNQIRAFASTNGGSSWGSRDRR